MKIHTLPDLLMADPTSEEAMLVREALAALLNIDPSHIVNVVGELHPECRPALAAWRSKVAGERASFDDRIEHWQFVNGTSGSANRRDGVSLSHSSWGPPPDNHPCDPLPWIVMFPPALGGASPQRTVYATTLADAIDQVDARWPIAPWWAEFHVQPVQQGWPESSPVVHQVSKPPPVPRPTGVQLRALLDKKIDFLELTVRAENCLDNEGVVYVGDLVQKEEAQLLRTKNLGRKSTKIVVEALAQHGLSLEMDVQGWVRPENRNAPVGTTLRELLDVRIEDTTLPARAKGNLGGHVAPAYGGPVHHVGSLVKLTRDDLLRVRNLGAVTIHRIEQYLAEHDLALGMDVGDWEPPSGEEGAS